MRFKKTKEKYTDNGFWCASVINNGQCNANIYWMIYPHGAGFNLYRKIGIHRKAVKICHVKKFESAKSIANLMQTG